MMKFSLMLAAEPPEQLVTLAKAAEEAGFDGVSIADSICYPKEEESKYLYNADGSRDFLDGQPFIDPLLLAAHLSAVTSKLTFTTAVYKLPVRQPVIVAKQLASLAVLSNNRFKFGVGISPWSQDFAAAGVPWEKRGKRLNECIEIIRGLLSGEYFSFDSEMYQIPEIKLCPVPSQAVPILIGGHAEVALKRAARLGDGWIAAGGTADDFSPIIDRINVLRKEYGRDQLPFEVQANGVDTFSLDGLKKLTDIGVHSSYVGFYNLYEGKPDTRTLDEKIGQIQWYGSELIGKYRA
ncbi:MAG: TIGR03619 family F420-dependent LLM class oxidoreductase [Pseudomonadales bacterium]